MTILVHSGYSIQYHQNNERHTTKMRIHSAEKKRQPAVQYPEKDYFPVSNIRSSKGITAYV